MTRKKALIAAILVFERDTAGIGRYDLAAMGQRNAIVGALLDATRLGREHRAVIAARGEAMIAAVNLVQALRVFRSTGGQGERRCETDPDVVKVGDRKPVAMLVDAMKMFDKMTFGLNARTLMPVKGERWDPRIPEWRVGAAAGRLIFALDRAAGDGDTTVRNWARTVH